MKHLLNTNGMTEKNLCEILNLADQLKFEKQNKIPHPLSASAVVGIIGDVPALTAAAADIASYELGAHATRLPEVSPEIASRLADCIIAGFSDSASLERFADGSSVPVISAKGEGGDSPLEKLASLMTVREDKGTFSHTDSECECISKCDMAENILHVTKAVLVKALKLN